MRSLLRYLAPPTTILTGIAFLVLRVVAGYALHLHGVPKMHDPLHWLDASAALSSAVPAPPFLEPVVAFAEGLGGFLIVLGLFTRLIAIVLVCDLATVVVGVDMLHGHAFVGGPGAYEVPALLLTIVLALLVAGPGRYSLDALIASRAGGRS